MGLCKTASLEFLVAKYGTSDVQNAIHCTDLAEDGESDSNYLFNVLF